jgi:hypothetical protein
MGKRGPTAEELGDGQKWYPSDGPSRIGDSTSNWDIAQKDKLFSGFSHISRERWEEIFGPKCPQARSQTTP